METQIIDGKALAKQWQEKLKTQVERMERVPTLAVILVGNDPASEIYVRHKRQVAERVGITSELFQLSPVMTQERFSRFSPARPMETTLTPGTVALAIAAAV